jgi:hypothetical protein
MEFIEKLFDTENLLILVAGAIIVAIFALYQYHHWTGDERDKPDNPPRYYTSFIRFYFFGFVYVGVFWLAFLILIGLPVQLVTALRTQLTDYQKAMNTLEAFADPRFIFAVMFITTASTKIPIVVNWEKKLRETLHICAKTPSQVRDVIEHLMKHRQRAFTATSNDINTFLTKNPGLHKYLYTQYFKEDGVPRDDKSRLLTSWVEICYLRWKMEEIQPQSQLHTCKISCINQYDLFNKNYESLKEDVETYFYTKTTFNAFKEKISDNEKQENQTPPNEWTRTFIEKVNTLLLRLKDEATHKSESLLRELQSSVKRCLPLLRNLMGHRFDLHFCALGKRLHCNAGSGWQRKNTRKKTGVNFI